MAAKKKTSTSKKSSVIFVKPYVYIENLSDGSAGVSFFNTADEAEAYAEPDGERYCDDIFQVTLVIDPKTLKVCNVKKPRKEDD